MAALTLWNPTTGGTAVTPATASGSDTISQAQLGTSGVNLIVQTTGTICTITISDASLTPGASNPATVTGVATVATGVKAFYISPAQCAPGGNVTITATPITGLTYQVYPA